MHMTSGRVDSADADRFCLSLISTRLPRLPPPPVARHLRGLTCEFRDSRLGAHPASQTGLRWYREIPILQRRTARQRQ